MDGTRTGPVDEDGPGPKVDAHHRLLARLATHLQAELVGVARLEFSEDLEGRTFDLLPVQRSLADRDRASSKLSSLAADLSEPVNRRFCTIRRPSEVWPSVTERAIVMAPRQGDVGMSLAYCQLFIQAIQTGRPSGASFQTCEGIVILAVVDPQRSRPDFLVGMERLSVEVADEVLAARLRRTGHRR